MNTRRIILALAIALSSLPCWANAVTRTVPSQYATIQDAIDAAQFGCVKWSFNTNGPVTSSVTLGKDGRVHIACEDGAIYTLDPNGQLLWSFDTHSEPLSAPSVGRDGSLYIGCQNQNLYALAPDGGDWLSYPVLSPTGDIYISDADNTVWALTDDCPPDHGHNRHHGDFPTLTR